MAPRKLSYTLPRVLFGLGRFAERETGLSSDAPAGSLPRVSWVDYDQGPLTKPFVSIRKFGPSRNDGFANEYLREVPTQQRLTITQTVEGEYVVACGIWSETRTTVDAGDDLEATRDKFLLAWQATIADTQEPLIFVADGLTDILITAKPWAIPDVVAVQGCTLADPAPIVVDAKVESVQRLYRIRFTFYGFDLDGDEAEDEYVSQLQTSLESTDGVEFLKQYGLGIQGPPSTAQDATVQVGPLRVRIVFVDATVVTRRTTYDTALGSSAVIDQVDPPVIQGIFG